MARASTSGIESPDDSPEASPLGARRSNGSGAYWLSIGADALGETAAVGSVSAGAEAWRWIAVGVIRAPSESIDLGGALSVAVSAVGISVCPLVGGWAGDVALPPSRAVAREINVELSATSVSDGAPATGAKGISAGGSAAPAAVPSNGLTPGACGGIGPVTG